MLTKRLQNIYHSVREKGVLAFFGGNKSIDLVIVIT